MQSSREHWLRIAFEHFLEESAPAPVAKVPKRLRGGKAHFGRIIQGRFERGDGILGTHLAQGRRGGLTDVLILVLERLLDHLYGSRRPRRQIRWLPPHFPDA